MTPDVPHAGDLLAARAEAFIAALEATVEVVDEDPDARASIRRIGTAVADAAKAAAMPEIEAAAIELAASDQVGPVEIRALVALLSASRDGSDHRSVLIVEDDGVSAMVLHSISKNSRSAVRVVHTLADARTAISEVHPDVVLLDLFLPDGDGRTFLTELRADPATADSVVIVVSGSDHAYARAECAALGADHFVPKPVDPNRLVTLLTEVTPRNLPEVSRLVDRSVVIREFAGGVSSQTVSMLRFHPVSGIGDEATDAQVRRSAEQVAERLADKAVVADWADGLFCAVMNESVDEGAATLNDVRMALRVNRTSDVAMTFAAGVAESSGSGLLRAIAAGSRRMFEALRRGGDRVVAPDTIANARVLFADDDRVMAALVVARLETQGFEVDYVEDGAQALEAIKKTLPSLILLDVDMPTTDGFGVLEAVRTTHATAEIPVIMLTGADSESSVIRAFALGANDYVVKPFSPSELTARVERLLR